MSIPTWSKTLKLCKALLGPNARVWRREPGFIVGTERNGVKEVKGQGATLVEAVRAAFPEHIAAVEERLRAVREVLDNMEKAAPNDSEGLADVEGSQRA